jgi:hypothetical protein
VVALSSSAAPAATNLLVDLFSGRIFCGKPASTFPENAPMIVRIFTLHQGSTDIDHLFCRRTTSWQRLVCLSARLQKWNSIAHDARYLFCLRGMKVTTRGAPTIIHDRAAVSEPWRSVQQCDNVARCDQINGVRAVTS